MESKCVVSICMWVEVRFAPQKPGETGRRHTLCGLFLLRAWQYETDFAFRSRVLGVAVRLTRSFSWRRLEEELPRFFLCWP